MIPVEGYVAAAITQLRKQGYEQYDLSWNSHNAPEWGFLLSHPTFMAFTATQKTQAYADYLVDKGIFTRTDPLKIFQDGILTTGQTITGALTGQNQAPAKYAALVIALTLAVGVWYWSKAK